MAKALGGTVSNAEKKETIGQIANGLSRKAVERSTVSPSVVALEY